jgi:hypothetical protein
VFFNVIADPLTRWMAAVRGRPTTRRP